MTAVLFRSRFILGVRRVTASSRTQAASSAPTAVASSTDTGGGIIAGPLLWSTAPTGCKPSVSAVGRRRSLAGKAAASTMGVRHQHHQRPAAPSAPQKTKIRRNALRHPFHNQPDDPLAESAMPPSSLAQQRLHPAFLEPTLPSGDRSGAAKQHGRNRTPRIPCRQQQQDMRPQMHRRARIPAILLHQRLAFRPPQSYTAIHGLASKALGLASQQPITLAPSHFPFQEELFRPSGCITSGWCAVENARGEHCVAVVTLVFRGHRL
jgi:hypothetical protein